MFLPIKHLSFLFSVSLISEKTASDVFVYVVRNRPMDDDSLKIHRHPPNSAERLRE
jgi:hypothetical protein